MLVKELGLDGEEGCATYEKIVESSSDIVEQDLKVLKGKYNLDISEDDRTLPHIYWMPKLHKDPIKFRFIIAAPSCSVKPLSKVLTKILKLFFRQIESYLSLIHISEPTRPY